MHGALEPVDTLQHCVERPSAEQHLDRLGVSLDVELPEQQADARPSRGERASHDGRPRATRRAWTIVSDRCRRARRAESARARASATSDANSSTAALRSVAASDAGGPAPADAPSARPVVVKRRDAEADEARYLALPCKGRGSYHRRSEKCCLQRFCGRFRVQPSDLAA